jgi:hypothetical protein
MRSQWADLMVLPWPAEWKLGCLPRLAKRRAAQPGDIAT